MPNKQYQLTQPTTDNIRDILPHINATIAHSKEEDDRQFVTALARGLSILSCFEGQDVLSHQMICQMTNLPKATISRLIYTLLKVGFLRQTLTGEYQLGSATVRLSASAWGNHDLVQMAAPQLYQFAHQHQVSVNLACEMEGQMRYLACCRSPSRLAVNLKVGSTVPIHQTAIGRAYFAVCSKTTQQKILNHMMETQIFHQAALNQPDLDMDDFHQQLHFHYQFYCQHGYAISDGDYSSDILAVGVGVFDKALGCFTHAINASVPKAHWQADEYVDYIVPKLQKLAEKIGDWS